MLDKLEINKSIKIKDSDNNIEYTTKIEEIEKVEEDTYIYVDFIISEGRYVKLEKTDTYLINFMDEKNIYEFKASIIKYIKIDKLPYMKIKILDKGTRLQRREYYRLKIEKEFNFINIADEELIITDEKLIITDEKLIRTGEELIRTDEDLIRTDEDLIKTGEEISKTGEELIKTGEEISKTGEELIRTDEDLIKTGEEISKTDEEISKMMKNMLTGYSIDICAGGMMFYTNDKIDEKIRIFYKLGDYLLIAEGDIVSCIDDINNMKYTYTVRCQFTETTKEGEDKLIKFIFSEERRRASISKGSKENYYE